MNQESAIKVNKVYKDFILPHNRSRTFKGLITGLFKESYTKEKQHALKNISFEVKRGEFFGIVGRNGSGKSTLLKILAGIYQPNKGRINVKGKLVPFIELGVGFNPELSGRDNVYLNGALLGFSKKQVDAMYEDIVQFAELDRFMDQKLKNYSSGMQVRLAFSMAIRSDADILLIDEVLAVGDAEFQQKCYEYFKNLKNSNKTVVFISHDMGAIREFCDRAMLIDENVVVDIGSTEKITEEYLKLFNNVKNVRENINKKWGNGAAQLDDINISLSDKEIIVDLYIKANKTISDSYVGIRIRDLDNREITGSNTKLQRLMMPKLTTNQKLTLEWKFPNIFSDGEYALDTIIQDNNDVMVYEWKNDAAIIKISRDFHMPYSVDPGFNIEIKSSK